MNKITVLVGVIATVALVLSVVATTEPARTIVERQIGSVVGDTDSFECKTSNGMTTCSTRRPLATATTTPCAVRSPSATSTLVRSTTIITVGTSTATTWTVAKAATAFATTTPLSFNFTLSSGAQGTMGYFGTSTAAGVTPIVDQISTFAPNTWVTWGVAGVQPADTSLLKGFCSAQFQVL